MKKLHTLCGVLERDFRLFTNLILSRSTLDADKFHFLSVSLIDIPFRGIAAKDIDKFYSPCKLENCKEDKSTKNSTDDPYRYPQADYQEIPSNNGGDF